MTARSSNSNPERWADTVTAQERLSNLTAAHNNLGRLVMVSTEHGDPQAVGVLIGLTVTLDNATATIHSTAIGEKQYSLSRFTFAELERGKLP